MCQVYSIVKDSSADLGVNSKIVQIGPTVKAVSIKIGFDLDSVSFSLKVTNIFKN